MAREPIPVLLAGGNDSIRRAIRMLLVESGELSVVAETADCADTVDLIDRLNPSVAVIDCDLDGPGFIESVRRLCRRANAPGIVLLDTYGQCAGPAAAVGARHLLKDAVARELVPVVRQIVQGRGSAGPDPRETGSSPEGSK